MDIKEDWLRTRTSPKYTENNVNLLTNIQI